MYISRKKIDILEEDLSGLQKMNIFITAMHTKYWFTAGEPEISPEKNLKFLKNLSGNCIVDENLRASAHDKFTEKHLW